MIGDAAMREVQSEERPDTGSLFNFLEAIAKERPTITLVAALKLAEYGRCPKCRVLGGIFVNTNGYVWGFCNQHLVKWGVKCDGDIDIVENGIPAHLALDDYEESFEGWSC